MLRHVLGPSVGMLMLFLSPPAGAQTPACDSLSGEQKQLAMELLSSQHPYDCCDETILSCLKQDKVCSLVWRLAENICHRISKKQDRTKIVRGLSRRARSMLPSGPPAPIDMKNLPRVGNLAAPVKVVGYQCARCPFCSKITPVLYDAVKDGPLKDKVEFYFKLFPIRGHPFSKETGLGFMAAVEMGKFWEFALYSYEHFDFFCIKKQPEWAEAAGLDRDTFLQLVSDPRTRERLVASKKEGILNKVDATPTFFINGRKYMGDMNIDEMIDVLEEEYERITGVEYRK